jgi:hypothetical protein
MRLVHRRYVISLLLLAVAFLVSAAAPAAGDTTYSAKIFVSEKFPALHGAIHSRSAFCVAKRPVLVYRVRSGKDKLVGHRRSHGDGTWKVPLGKKLGPGSYLVEAPLFGSAALGIKCLPVKSKIVPVE